MYITIKEAEASEYKQANLREKLLVKGLQADELQKLIFTFNFINEAGISRDDVDTNWPFIRSLLSASRNSHFLCFIVKVL